MASSRDKMSIPDVADRHRRLVAYAVLLIGVRYVASAASRFAEPALASLLGRAADGCALVAIGFLIPIFVWKARNLSNKDWHLYKGADGVVADTITRAKTASWVIIFLALILAEPIANRVEVLTTGLLLEGLLAIMLLSFAISFLYLDREPAEDPADSADG